MPDSNPDVVPLVSSSAPVRNPVVAFARFVLGGLPTLLVLTVAGAIGWYGHHHNWQLPKFSELRGEVPELDDWCKEHNVPESMCVECQLDLLPRPEAKGWCQTHGVSDCVLCNPTLAQLKATPSLSAADLERAAESLKYTERPANSWNCRTHQRRLQLTSHADAVKTGIEVREVGTGSVTEGVSAVGELGHDQTRVAHLSARSPGTVWKVFKRLGQTAEAGEVLALIEAAEVGRAKAEILSAFGTAQLRQQSLDALRESGVAASARVREAEGAVREAHIRLAAGCQALTNLGLPFDETATVGLTAESLKAKLLLLGIPADVAAGIDRKTASANLLPLFAPMGGLIVSRDVVAGEVVDLTKILFELVDTRNLWLTLDLKGEDAARVAVGQTVRFTPDGGKPGEVVNAVINWKSTQVDPRTRTVKVRADVPDPDGKLLANTFGTGFVVLREQPSVVAVPSEAIHWEGCCHIVFVQDKGYDADDPKSFKVFHVRKVRPGVQDGVRIQKPGSTPVTGTEIAAGVLPGELVVTKGGGALLGELLRGELGDGCCGQVKE